MATELEHTWQYNDVGSSRKIFSNLCDMIQQRLNNAKLKQAKRLQR